MASQPNQTNDTQLLCQLCGQQFLAPKSVSAFEGSEPVPRCPRCRETLANSCEVLAVLRRRMAQVLEIPEHSIEPSTPLFEIATDSMATVELMLVLDEEFSLSLPEECLDELATVGDLIEVIDRERRR